MFDLGVAELWSLGFLGVFLCSRIKNLQLFSTVFQSSSRVSGYYVKQLVCAAWQMLSILFCCFPAFVPKSSLLCQCVLSLLCCSVPLVCWLHSFNWRMLLKFPSGALCGHSDQTSGMAGPWQGSLLLFCAERAPKCTSHSISHQTACSYGFICVCNACLLRSMKTKEELEKGVPEGALRRKGFRNMGKTWQFYF